MTAPWCRWYHAVGTTYGAWLRGDERGWRARHHREHVEGDYRHRPPTGTYEQIYATSLALMTRAAVVLPPPARQVVLDAMVGKLLERGTEVARMCVGGCHFHLLMRIDNPRMAMQGLCADNALQDGRDPLPRHVVGMARKHASHTLRERGMKERGTLWAKRPKFVPVENERHFLWIKDIYIPRHADEGAVVYP